MSHAALLAWLAGRVGDSSGGARAARRDRQAERGRGASGDSPRRGAGLTLLVPGQANQQTRLSFLFPRCPARGYCRGPDGQNEGQTEGESRNSYGLRSRWIPPPPPPTLPSLEKRISMPRCQGMCPLSLGGLLLGWVPGCLSFLPRVIRPHVATEDPTRSFLGREWLETGKQLALEG